MFALLFDRKSLTMTLLSLGGMGLLLFVSGFALGSYLNGGLEHLGVIAQEIAPTNRPGASRTTAPALRRSLRGTPATPAQPAAAPEIIESEDPALSEPAAEPSGELMDETSGPPTDWVPLEEGGAWPGGQETAEAAHLQVAETETAEMEFAEPHSPAAPAAPAAPRRAQGFYYVQLGTFSREELAQEKRAEVESRVAAREDESVEPFLAPVTDRGGHTAYVVRVGPFPSRVAAREAATGYGRASVVWSSSGRAL
jgi:septal ring-binding cell division protein DamX